jgi:hypothetical protein
MQKKYFKTRTAEITEEKDFVRITIIPGSVVDKEDALDNMLVIKNICGNQKTLKLVDLRGKWRITPEARRVTEKNTSELTTIAAAYIIDSFLTNITIRFLKAIGKGPGIPQEFFRSEQKAIDWLMQFKKQ